jgi:hypothetical protein
MTVLSLRRHYNGLGLSSRRARRASDAPGGDTQAPSIPQNLNAAAVSSSQVDLTWNASTDNVAVTGYNVYRDNVLVDTSPTNAYSDAGLAPATLYQYEVTAFDAAANESARSAPASATTHPAIVTAGLVAEWRFDDGAGQQITDHSGQGNHAIRGTTGGADANEPAWSPTGMDCDLDAPTNYITTGRTLGISGGAARSVVMVVNMNTSFAAGVNTGASFLRWLGGTGAGERWLFMTPPNSAALRLQGSSGQGTTTALTLSHETWHMVAATMSGNNLNTATLYRDGNSAAVTTNQTVNTNGNVDMCSSQGTGASGADKIIKIAYGLVYNRALAPAEIAQNRQALAAILAGRGITLP